MSFCPLPPKSMVRVTGPRLELSGTSTISSVAGSRSKILMTSSGPFFLPLNCAESNWPVMKGVSTTPDRYFLVIRTSSLPCLVHSSSGAAPSRSRSIPACVQPLSRLSTVTSRAEISDWMKENFSSTTPWRAVGSVELWIRMSKNWSCFSSATSGGARVTPSPTEASSLFRSVRICR